MSSRPATPGNAISDDIRVAVGLACPDIVIPGTWAGFGLAQNGFAASVRDIKVSSCRPASPAGKGGRRSFASTGPTLAKPYEHAELIERASAALSPSGTQTAMRGLDEAGRD